ncbi:hypothetical protein V5E97_08635 [Singulisphaera sp. Ch08]|uniref:Uncharacterized protein n=1 Tax=Singulisphaera sp. Ch08 TaxID=3120278 RepID=A0AAU7CM51_9BACT
MESVHARGIPRLVGDAGCDHNTGCGRGGDSGSQEAALSDNACGVRRSLEAAPNNDACGVRSSLESVPGNRDPRLMGDAGCDKNTSCGPNTACGGGGGSGCQQ